MYWRNKDRTAKVYADKPGDKQPLWVIRPDGSDARVLEPMHYQCAMEGRRAPWKPMVGRRRRLVTDGTRMDTDELAAMINARASTSRK